MEMLIVNKKNVKKNKALKRNQKASKKMYGKGKKEALRGCIQKLFLLNDAPAKEVLPKYREELSFAKLEGILKERNVFGLSGDQSDVIQKMTGVLKHTERALIINGAECDPCLVTDAYLLHNHLEDILDAVHILDSAIGFQNIYFCTKEAVALTSNKIQPVRLPNVFPIGYENYLIEYAMRKKIKGYPSENGILVFNVQTLLAIKKACLGMDNTSRYITVGNFVTGEAKVMRAEYGTKLSECIKDMGYQPELALYAGGGLTYSMPAALTTEVTGGTGFIGIAPKLVITEKKCIGCGGCEKKCPAGVPTRAVVLAHMKGSHVEKDTSMCIRCGLCSYSCPAGIDIRLLVMKNNHEI